MNLDEYDYEKMGDLPIVVSYGGGTNSTALLIALWLKQVPVTAILFADTGNEKPETYRHLEKMDAWLKSHGMPTITKVQYKMKNAKPRNKVAMQIPYKWYTPNIFLTTLLRLMLTLHIFRQEYKYTNLGEESLTLGGLPAKAFGNGACSSKWKVEPFQQWIKRHFKDGALQMVGIHAGEQRRLLDKQGNTRPRKNEVGFVAYPLVVWGLDQKHCNALNKAYLDWEVSKSACWFCPNAKYQEVQALKKQAPELYELGVAMEALAQSHGIKNGLARGFRWADVDCSEQLSLDFAFDLSGESCHCVD